MLTNSVQEYRMSLVLNSLFKQLNKMPETPVSNLLDM